MARGRSSPAPARSASSAAPRARPAASSSSSTAARPAAPHSPPQQHAAPAAPAAAAPASRGWFGGSKPAAPAPAPMGAPAPAVGGMGGGGGGGMMSGLMGAVVTGAAMGTGSAIAHRAVDSMMGPRETASSHQNEPAPAAAAPAAPMMSSPMGNDGPCGQRVKEFADCMSRANGEMSACSFYFDSMQSCKTEHRMV